MVKDTNTEKANLRNFSDGFYTRADASRLLQSIKEDECKEIWEEVTAEVWEETGNRQPVTDLEREKYKKEARLLLKRMQPPKRTWARRLVALAAGAAAAVAIWMASIGYFRYMNEQPTTFTEIATSYGEKRQVELPDGTLLFLNSCSQIRYPDPFQGNIRKVELKGQGYFQVARNEKMPFVVKTEQFDVRVLGTRFDVKSYPTDEIVSVSVESGKVQVEMPEATMRLVAKEQVLMNTTSGEYSKMKEKRSVAKWRKGNLYFNSTPIRDVAKELERVYNCRITFAPDQIFDNLITGEHDNQSLEAVLESLEFITGNIRYKKEGNNILFYKK